MAESASFLPIDRDVSWEKARPLLNKMLTRAFDIFAQATRYDVRDVTAHVAIAIGVRTPVVRANAAGSVITVTLPDARDVTERLVIVKRMNSGANAVTVDGFGAQTIDGAATVVLGTQYAVARLVSDGAAWSLL